MRFDKFFKIPSVLWANYNCFTHPVTLKPDNTHLAGFIFGNCRRNVPIRNYSIKGMYRINRVGKKRLHALNCFNKIVRIYL